MESFSKLHVFIITNQLLLLQFGKKIVKQEMKEIEKEFKMQIGTSRKHITSKKGKAIFEKNVKSDTKVF